MMDPKKMCTHCSDLSRQFRHCPQSVTREQSSHSRHFPRGLFLVWVLYGTDHPTCLGGVTDISPSDQAGETSRWEGAVGETCPETGEGGEYSPGVGVRGQIGSGEGGGEDCLWGEG